MKILNGMVVVSLMLFLGACSTETSKNSTFHEDEGGQEEQQELASFKSHYLLAVNRARSVSHTCGSKGFFPSAPALKWSEKLYAAAYEHTLDMATTNTFGHSGSGEASDVTGQRLGHPSRGDERVLAQGYRWRSYGENVGAGTNRSRAEDMVQGFLESDGHCANMMNPNFKELGMAMVKNENSTYTHYWTQNFGTR